MKRFIQASKFGTVMRVAVLAYAAAFLFAPSSLVAQTATLYYCMYQDGMVVYRAPAVSSTRDAATLARDFGKFVKATYGPPKNNPGIDCDPISSRAEADAQFAHLKSVWNSYVGIDTSWNGQTSTEGSGTSMGEAPTEAGALYNAEHSASTPVSRYIKSWGTHSCQKVTAESQYPTTTKTGMYSNQAKVSYRCSVNYQYSDARSPVASATLGDAATRVLAIEKAERYPISLGTVVAWGEPMCSQTTKITNQYDPGHPSVWWVCEVDYKTAH
jgi:hypothetical protein